MRRSLAVLAVLLLASAGCSSSSQDFWTPDTTTDMPGDHIDSGTDPYYDPGFDPGWDPGSDPIPDSFPDPATDPGFDPGTDPWFDPGTDPGFDPGYDPGFDPGFDPGVDTRPDTGTDPGFDPGTGGRVGDACYSTSGCLGVPGSGRSCLSSIMGYVTFPGGYCSATCTSSVDCGTGGSCVDFLGYGYYCLETCTSYTSCRTSEGYTCGSLPTATGTYCIPPLPGPDGWTD